MVPSQALETGRHRFAAGEENQPACVAVAHTSSARPDVQHGDAITYKSASRGWSTARADSTSSSTQVTGS